MLHENAGCKIIDKEMQVRHKIGHGWYRGYFGSLNKTSGVSQCTIELCGEGP
jgi:hypothetical protein